MDIKKESFFKPIDLSPKPKVDVKIEGKALPNKTERKQKDEILDYEIIMEIKLDDLKRLVRQHIKAGWEPLGGARYCERMGNWYQALIFKES